MAREVWITGYGLLSPQGETPDEWWPKLQDPALFRQAIDSESFPPFHVFPIRNYDLSRQVPKPGDQRAMGPLMHYGAYAAGVALDAAGIKGNEALLLETNLVVAAGGGERDWTLDHQLIAELDKAPDKAAVLNRRLSDDLRPTLFLAQLPNLFAGNISLVHGVSGSSRTFMGEEPAGVDAVRIAFEKIAAGQGDLFLVGAASNASRPDILYALHAGGLLMTAPPDTNLWDRPEAGIDFGSAGAFLVLESREHAEARGAEPSARLSAVLNDRSDRRPGAAAAKARRQLDRLAPALKRERVAVLSGACGMRGITREEHGFLDGARRGRHEGGGARHRGRLRPQLRGVVPGQSRARRLVPGAARGVPAAQSRRAARDPCCRRAGRPGSGDGLGADARRGHGSGGGDRWQLRRQRAWRWRSRASASSRRSAAAARRTGASSPPAPRASTASRASRPRA